MPWRGAACSLLLVLAALACGGRYNGSPGDDGSAGTSQSAGGKPSKGGTGSKPDDPPPIGVGATVSTGGKGAVGTAGTASSSGGACRSGPGGCVDGAFPVFDAYGCFSGCQVGECAGVICQVEPCEIGQHLEQLSGECCPSCVSDNKLSCPEARMQYEQLRRQLVEKYQSSGCQPNSACAIFWESNRCASSCGTPIPAGARDSAEENLGNWADANCGACPPVQPTPCPMPPAYGCVNNACQYLF